MGDRFDVRRAVETVHRLLRFLVGSTHVNAFRLAWLALLFYGERLVFHNAATSCPWPRSPTISTNETQSAVHVLLLADPQIIDRLTYPNMPFASIFYRFAQHFTDNYIKNVWLALAVNPNKWMKRGHILTPAQEAQRRTRTKAGLVQPPDGVVYVGDLTDGGRREQTQREWDALVNRFRSIFWRPSDSDWLAPPPHLAPVRELIVPRTSATAFIPTFFLSGNHDIGLPGVSMGHRTDRLASNDTVDRFNSIFGMKIDAEDFVVKNRNAFVRFSLNGRVLVSADAEQGATHELIMVNAQDLIGMERQGAAPAIAHFGSHRSGTLDDSLGEHARTQFNDTYNFVQSVKEGAFRVPRVLLTHVPLFRPEEASCNDAERSAVHGVTRESSRTIRQGTDQASTYQNLISSSVSDWVLQSIDPMLIFSGDDHDHCEYRHPRIANGSATHAIVDGFEQNQIPELTVKSVSMAEGVRVPGFARLSLFSKPKTSESETYTTMAYTPCLLPDQISIWTWLYLTFFLVTILGLIAWPQLRRRGPKAPGYMPLDRGLSTADEEEQDPLRVTELPVQPASRMGMLRRLCQDVFAVSLVALPFWILCQTHVDSLI